MASDLRAYPPLYTQQPVEATFIRQLAAWSILIRTHCSRNGIFTIVLSAALNSDPFFNSAINKRVSPEFQLRIFQYMAENKECILTNGNTTALVFPKPLPELADAVWKALERKNMQRTVLTVHEQVNFLQGDQLLKDMPLEILEKCLVELEDRKLLTVMRDGTAFGMETGIKTHAPV